MKSFEIKITGSGTKNQIEIALLMVVREIQIKEEDEIIGNYENDILCVEITPF